MLGNHFTIRLMAEPSSTNSEWSPLLPQSPTASISSASKPSGTLANLEATQQNDLAPAISALRGILVVVSIGLLIFLQGRSQGEIIFISLLLNISTCQRGAVFQNIYTFSPSIIWLNLDGCRLHFGSYQYVNPDNDTISNCGRLGCI